MQQKRTLSDRKRDDIVKAAIEKIIEVPRTVERIKEVKVRIEKIVEKMV